MRLTRLAALLVPASLSAVALGAEAPADSGLASTGSPASQTNSVVALEEVIVTAQKREEKLRDVPMGVTALPGDEMKRLQVVSFADLGPLVPALSVESIAPGQSRLTLRGENVGSVGSTVGTYIDETPFGSSNALANGSVVSGDFDTWDLQRIEVLRGPQGTLYGAGSEGGLLKYVTNPPEPGKFAGAFQVGDEDVAHGGSGANVKGMVNLPLGDRAAFRVAAYSENTSGWIDDPSLGLNNLNRTHTDGVRASVLWNVTDSFTLRFTGMGQQLQNDGTPYTDVVGGGLDVLNPPANQLEPTRGDYVQKRFISEPSLYKYDNYSLTADWNMGWADAISITSYGTSRQVLNQDETSAPLIPGFTFGDLVTGLVGVPAGTHAYGALRIAKLTQEVRLSSPANQKIEWQVGGYFTREASRLAQSFDGFFIDTQQFLPLPSIETAGLDSRYKEYAGFGQVTYHFNEQFDVAVGGRYSSNKQSALETIGGLLVQPPELITGGSTGHDFTYSFAPRWHINPNTLAYARIASGYRPGGPNALPPGAPAGVERQYVADSTVNYELGLKTSLLDNTLSLDVATFLINWKKIQLTQVVDGFGIDANGGSAHSRGLEWTAIYAPTRGLTLTLSGAYVNAKLTEPAPDAGGETGDKLPYAPTFSSSADVAYEWHVVRDFNATVGATWSYTGTRLIDFSAVTNVVGGQLVSVPVPRAELPSYNTINLRGGLANDTWSFEIYCKNAGDKRGIAVYTNSGTPDFGGEIGYIQPRTLGASLGYRF